MASNTASIPIPVAPPSAQVASNTSANQNQGSPQVAQPSVPVNNSSANQNQANGNAVPQSSRRSSTSSSSSRRSSVANGIDQQSWMKHNWSTNAPDSKSSDQNTPLYYPGTKVLVADRYGVGSD